MLRMSWDDKNGRYQDGSERIVLATTVWVCQVRNTCGLAAAVKSLWPPWSEWSLKAHGDQHVWLSVVWCNVSLQCVTAVRRCHASGVFSYLDKLK
jgi:hypothetical protein